MTPTDGYPADIFTEPDGSPDTLANLGPLAPLAGTWRGRIGQDDHPVATGDESEPLGGAEGAVEEVVRHDARVRVPAPRALNPLAAAEA